MWGLPAQFGIDSASPASGGPPSIIKSIQTVTIQLGVGVTTNTATITSVVTGNSAIFLQGYLNSTAGSINPASTSCDVTLTNSTTVTLTRSASNSDGITARLTVVEFTSAAVNSSTQIGTINMASKTSGTATISTVSANAFVINLGVIVSNGASVSYGVSAIGLQLTNSTTVTAFAGVNSSQNGTVRFMVVDLKPSAISSVVQVTPSLLNSTDGLSYATFSPNVDLSKSIVVYNGQTVNSTTANTSVTRCQAQLVASNVAACNRQNATSASLVTYLTIIQWNPAVVKGNVQRGLLSLNSQVSNNATISCVSTTKSICNAAGWSTTGTTGTTGYLTTRLTGNTTITLDANASTTAVGSYEVVQFN